MDHENLDIENILESRRHHAEASLTKISHDELVKLAEQLFPGTDHPWQERFIAFIAENQAETFYSGNAGEGFEFIFCPARRAGLWYHPQGARGVGPIQERGVLALLEMTAAK